jgi:hypothetical protein
MPRWCRRVRCLRLLPHGRRARGIARDAQPHYAFQVHPCMSCTLCSDHSPTFRDGARCATCGVTLRRHPPAGGALSLPARPAPCSRCCARLDRRERLAQRRNQGQRRKWGSPATHNFGAPSILSTPRITCSASLAGSVANPPRPLRCRFQGVRWSRSSASLRWPPRRRWGALACRRRGRRGPGGCGLSAAVGRTSALFTPRHCPAAAAFRPAAS